ncbi:KpsF/GutQ family sugar-phosphate isomerase [Solicola gregarius]|uniref:SIS domain-containing protein n=1 Tax=Solicola gregarius TaxID=2908642 RepID=A0AA46TK56_9ACTN|nr:SIS domain-containing protein [Solicola gregarius]UYM05918.1 SIS domain-containing protein [Solicola gregarius]
MTDDPLIAIARETLLTEASAIKATAEELGPDFRKAIDLLASASGRVVVTGLGKSGHIGHKMAATFASTGTPSVYVHATEALHGDSGMVQAGDATIAISNSGTTAEVVDFAAHLHARGIPIVAMTAGGAESPLGRVATVVLDTRVEREADPLGLAPTTSTTVTLSLGDALAAALMTLSAFTHSDFRSYHPGGSLGAQLATHDDADPEGTPE